MVSWLVKLKIAYWFKVAAYGQIDQYITRRRTYLEGEFCMYNEKQKEIYRAYLDRLEKRLKEAMAKAVI